MTSDARALDGSRLVLFAFLSGALGVAVAEAFVQFSPRGDIGATAASLDDAFAWILGGCLGLLIGSTATAPFVRYGSHLVAGILAGVAGFWIGVAPYLLLTAPSDVSFSDAFGFVVIVFVPGLLFAVARAAIGAASRRLLRAA
jgi:hypothetical protein